MNPLEECVEFKNPEGFLLRGILHYGNDSSYKKTTIICLNTGLNDMVGWHRLQVKVARFLAEKGYNVLRFDDFGIGNSEGELDEGIVVELFAQVETGLWISDALSAVDFIQNKFENEDIVFLGYCGGALTAIHAAANDKRVKSVINIAAPVTLSTNEYLQKKDPWTVKKNIESYKKKLFKPSSLLNFITGKSDYSEVFRSIVHSFRHKIAGRYNKRSNSNNIEVDIDNLNFSIFDSFEKYMRTKIRPILFFYAGRDNATWNLKKYFLPKYVDEKVWKESGCEYIELENANHIFSGQSSQESLKQAVFTWLEKNREK